MKLFYCLIFVFILNGSYAQKFTLDNLVSLAKMNLDDFDTQILKKGFTFDEVSDIGNLGKRYSYAVSSSGSSAQEYIIYHKYNGGKVIAMVSWVMSSNADYLKIKKQLKLCGFTYLNSGEFNDKQYFAYKKNAFDVILYVSTYTNSYDELVTMYEIQAFKMNR